jgi:hyperosmotically inducible periplasmic protein
MKKTALHLRLRQLISGPVALGLVILATGCAGNRYERSTGESIDDRATTTRVRSVLSDDAVYKYSDVKVTTFKGTVQLSGFVDTREQKSRATDLAKSVDGVRDIVNNISVKQ